MADITIVIPNYNGEAYLADCLRAVCAQTIDVDVFVVDDGSTDGSKALVEQFDADDTPLTLLAHETNKGFAAAVNTGIRAATTPYVILLNNDTIADKDMARELLFAIKKRRKAFAVSALLLQARRSATEKCDDAGSATAAATGNGVDLNAATTDLVDDAGDYYCALGWAFSQERDKPRTAAMQPKQVTSACAGAAIYDRERLVELGLFDEAHGSYLEDVDLGLRAARQGLRSYYEPDAVVYHFASATSGGRYNAFKTRQTTANNLYLIYKNFPAPTIALFFPLLVAGQIIKAVFYARKGLLGAYCKGVSMGFQKIRDHPERRARLTAKTLRYDCLLFFEALGNCGRRVFML